MHVILFRSVISVCALLLPCAGVAGGDDGLQVVSVKKIWHGDRHNAFTDLLRFEGKWFCTFRESRAHVGGNGRIRILTSADGEKWESSALLAEEGIDLRDPKLSLTPDRQLMLVMGGSVYADKVLKERQSRVAFSRDAVSWSVPQRVLARGDWLWRVTWHEGKAYGIAYGSSAGNAAGANKTPGMSAKLVISDDGRAFRMLAALDVSGSPNEATLRFLSNGDCVALVRRETDDKAAWIGLSSAPYLAWKWQPAGMQVGGPNFLVLKDDSMLASGRQYATTASGGNRTFVGRMSLHGIQSDLTLPSGGDCSYPGMVWDKGMLWLSYYSSHEGSTDIYLAKVRLP